MKFIIQHKQWYITLLLLLTWTILIGAITYGNVKNEHSKAEALILNQHRLSSIVIKTSWRWNSLHGGVYVPANANISPSPYLEEENRILITAGGDTLTKIPPTVMSDLTFELSGMQQSFDSKVVSITPLNPANRADEWEAAAIKEFEEAVAEGNPAFNPYSYDRYIIRDLYSENPEFRYISPITAGKSCLVCHHYGIKEGDVMGGLSYTINNKDFIGYFRGNPKQFISSSIVIWILGCVGILLLMKNISSRIQKELKLRKFEGVLEMAGSAAHELNQPLQVITGYAELISVIDTNDQKSLFKMLHEIRENVLRLSTITRKLNGITRYETIELTSKDRIIDLNKAASDTIPVASAAVPGMSSDKEDWQPES